MTSPDRPVSDSATTHTDTFKSSEIKTDLLEEEYKISFENVGVGLAHVSLDGSFLRVNKKLCEILGYKERELLNVSFKDISRHEDIAESLKWMKLSISGKMNESFAKIRRYRHKGGHLVWAKLTSTLVKNEQQEPCYFVSSIQDVSELKESEAALDESLIKLRNAYRDLERLSSIDGLTGSLNIRAFKKHLHFSIEQFRRYGTPATLLFVDLDDFKPINDEYGHACGDKALREITNKLIKEARKNDSIGRYGGDEFTVLLTNTDLSQALEYCNRIGKSIHIKIEDRDNPNYRTSVEVCFSVGVYQLTREIDSIDDWIVEADKLMYEQKQNKKAQKNC